jgi:hypothetical protein
MGKISGGNGGVGVDHNLLSATHLDTTPASPVVGDIIAGTAGPVWSRLSIGNSFDALGVIGGLPTWTPNFAYLPGRSGGQILYGGIDANNDLTLEGTSHATKTTSYVLLQPNGGNVGIGVIPVGLFNVGATSNYLLYDDTYHELRVGTNALLTRTYYPLGDAQIIAVRDDTSAKIRIATIGTGHQSFLAFDRARGTMLAPTKLISGDVFGSLLGVGYSETSGFVHGPEILFSTTEDWSGTNIGSGMTFYLGRLAGASQFIAASLGITGERHLTLPQSNSQIGVGVTPLYGAIHTKWNNQYGMGFESSQAGTILTILGLANDGTFTLADTGLLTHHRFNMAGGNTILNAQGGNVGVNTTPATTLNVLGDFLVSKIAGNLDDDIVLISGQPRVGIVQNTFSTGDHLWLVGIGNHAAGVAILGAKTRSTATDAATIVQDGDQLMTLIAVGSDGAGRYRPAAYISMYVDGTPGSADMPGRMLFATTADGSASPTERLRIDATGLATFANAVKIVGAFGCNNTTPQTAYG